MVPGWVPASPPFHRRGHWSHTYSSFISGPGLEARQPGSRGLYTSSLHGEVFWVCVSLIPTSSDSPGVELPATSLSLGPSGGPTTSLTCSLKYQPCYIPPISHPWGGLTLHLNIYHRVGLWILCFIPASQRILQWKDLSDIPPCRWKDWGSGTWRVVCPRHSAAEPRIRVFSNRLCWVATKMALTDKNNKKWQLVLACQLECQALCSILYR